MIFEEPCKKEFTIYSKSGCFYCNKAKMLLLNKSLPFKIIDCDEYIIENKVNFLSFIKNLTNKEVKTFPIIFYNDIFVGGFEDLTQFVDNLLLSMSFDDLMVVNNIF